MSVGMSVGTQPSVGRLAAIVRFARLAGFDSLWTVDHFTSFFPKSIWDRQFTWLAKAGDSPDAFFDYQTITGHLARRVGRAQLGIGVTEPIRRHPLVIAQAALSLSHLTRRPPILGIGAGERENTEPYGLSFAEPVARLEDALPIVKAALDGTSLRFEGRFFRIDDGHLDLRPGKAGRPQLWVAAHGPRMLKLTGRYADGWYPIIPMTPERYDRALMVVRSSAREAGRDQEAIVPALQAFVVVAPSDAEARRLLDSRAMRFLALLAPHQTWSEAGVAHPLGGTFRGMVDMIPSRLSRGQLEEAMAEVTVDVLANHILWGTRERVVAALRLLGEAGLRHVVLAPVSALVSRRAAFDAIRSLPWMVRALHG